MWGSRERRGIRPVTMSCIYLRTPGGHLKDSTSLSFFSKTFRPVSTELCRSRKKKKRSSWTMTRRWPCGTADRLNKLSSHEIKPLHCFDLLDQSGPPVGLAVTSHCPYALLWWIDHWRTTKKSRSSWQEGNTSFDVPTYPLQNLRLYQVPVNGAR